MLFGPLIGDTLYFWSMTQIGASRAMPLSSIYPLFTWLLAVPILGEPVSQGAIAGTLLALIGLYFLAPSVESDPGPTEKGNRLGVLAAIVAALMWAISTMLIKISLQDNVNIIAINSFRFPLGAIALTLFIVRWRDRGVWRGYNRSSLPVLIGISVLSVCLGSIFWVLSIEYTGAARASLLNAMAPLMGAPLAVIFLRERITWRIGFGTCLAVLGVALVI